MNSQKLSSTIDMRLLTMSIAAFLILCSSVSAIEKEKPAAYWSFDEQQGDSAYDLAGGNNGVVYGAQWTEKGQINGALAFDGKKNYVVIGNTANLESQQFTLSFWAQLNSPGKKLQGGISKGWIQGNLVRYSYGVVFHKGKAIASITNSKNKHINVYASIKDNDWHMWTVTVADGVLTVYKDGIAADVKEYGGTIEYYRKDSNEEFKNYNCSSEDSNHNNFVIGARDKGFTTFDGKMDEVIFYAAVLTAHKVKELYEVTLAHNFDHNVPGPLLARGDF